MTDHKLVFLTNETDLPDVPVALHLPQRTLTFFASLGETPELTEARLTPLTLETRLTFESIPLAEALLADPYTLFEGILACQYHETLTLTLIIKT